MLGDAYLITYEPIVGLHTPPYPSPRPGMSPDVHRIDDPIDARVVFVRENEDTGAKIRDAIQWIYDHQPGMATADVRVWKMISPQPRIVERIEFSL